MCSIPIYGFVAIVMSRAMEDIDDSFNEWMNSWILSLLVKCRHKFDGNSSETRWNDEFESFDKIEQVYFYLI